MGRAIRVSPVRPRPCGWTKPPRLLERIASAPIADLIECFPEVPADAEDHEGSR
jgi:hypothetical protein